MILTRVTALATLVASGAAMLFAGPTGASVDTSTTSSRAPALYKNCTNLNKRYPHGVGKVGARDRVTSGDPVTNFRRSNRIYRTAMSWNKGLDRDKDGIACEKA
jgi:hypothetical protein